jgi:outer membrane protein TolC
LLAQRPDVFAAQRAVAAASADVGTAEADRYPRLGLSGNITAIGSRGVGGDGNTWSVGPLQAVATVMLKIRRCRGGDG